MDAITEAIRKGKTMRLIDADVLIKVLEWCPYDEWLSEIDRLSTIEVVRCGECKRWDETYSFRWTESGKHICWGKCGLWNHQTESNAYCSYGERKEATNEAD